jgi:hypothetical protein
MQLLQRMAAPIYTCVGTGVLLIIGTPDGSIDPTGVSYYWQQ